MKTKSILSSTLLLASVLIITSVTQLNAQIANNYPNDTSIDLDSDVIFTEMFEDATSNLIPSGKWNNVSPNPLNILSDPSVPTNSLGQKSLLLRTIQDGTNQNQNSLVYKLLPTSVTDSIFVRYYVKYDTNTIYHHSGLWIGGKNPPSTIQGNIGGTLPLGDQEFHVGTEIRGTANVQPTTNSRFGLYTYWMGMHQSSNGPYYGNEFYNNFNTDNIDLASWNCIEVMIKLNNPVSSSNGEIKLWINGILISHLGYQFPSGTWNYNHFTEGAGTPFEGFQFRNDSALDINYIWLRNFNDKNPNNHIGNIYFDHLVVAKKYIGPISPNSTMGLNQINESSKILMYPNPATKIVNFSTKIDQLSIVNMLGQVVLKTNNVSSISTDFLKDGFYMVHANNKTFKLIVKHL